MYFGIVTPVSLFRRVLLQRNLLTGSGRWKYRAVLMEQDYLRGQIQNTLGKTSRNPTYMGLKAIVSRRIWTSILCFLLIPFARFTEPKRERQLSTNLYVMF